MSTIFFHSKRESTILHLNHSTRQAISHSRDSLGCFVDLIFHMVTTNWVRRRSSAAGFPRILPQTI
jgi:hypothetical protein